MAFKENELDHEQNHVVVCSNDPIFCTCLHLEMENNWGGVIVFAQKSIFYFLSAKNDISFCEEPTKKSFQNWITRFLKRTRPHCMYKSPSGCI
jgi:hypothetical protein